MRKLEQLTFILIMAGIALALLFYPFLPENIATRWDSQDNPYMYLPKWLGLFGIPFTSAILVIVFREIPKLDPYKDNIKQFRIYYDELLLVLTAFFFYIHFVMIIWNSGIRFYVLQLIAPAFGVLLFYIGSLLTRTQRNHIIGITSRWSLHSEALWKKIHVFAGMVFKTAGVLTCLGFVFYPFAIYFIVVPLLLAVVYTYVYSYMQYHALRTPLKKSKS